MRVALRLRTAATTPTAKATTPTAEALEQPQATTGLFCNRKRRFGRPARARVGKERRHPNPDVAARRSTNFFPRVETNARPAANADCAWDATAVRSFFADERRHQPLE